MSEQNIYKNPNRILKIIKYSPSDKDKLLSFFLSSELDELKALNIFEKDL